MMAKDMSTLVFIVDRYGGSRIVKTRRSIQRRATEQGRMGGGDAPSHVLHGQANAVAGKIAPKCLRTPPIGRQDQPLPEEDQPGGGKNAKNIRERKPEKNPSTPTSKSKYSSPTDFKQATKEFKNGDMEAEKYLPILRVRLLWVKVETDGMCTDD